MSAEICKKIVCWKEEEETGDGSLSPSAEAVRWAGITEISSARPFYVE